MKGGQIELSFGMIFSIVVIAATIAVAFYFIQKFVVSERCAMLGLLKEDLQESIDKVWASPFGTETFVGKLGVNIEKVCLGDLKKAGTKYAEIKDKLDGYANPEDNFYLYPPEKACKGSMASGKLKHIYSDNFTCFNVKDGKIEMRIVKENSSQTLVIIK